MGSIFDLVGAYKELYAMLTDADESDEQVINDTLEAVVGEIEVKGESYIMVCDRLDMEIDACKKQVAYWEHELSIRESGLKRLKDRLVRFLTMMGKKEIRTTNHTIKLCGNGGKVPIKYFDENHSDIPQKSVDLSKIPNEYKRVVVSESIDADKVRSALENGIKLDFAELGERGSYIKFK